jgi:hypothetical protein
MKPLEEELKSALRRVEPPEGFAQRVAARAASEAARQSKRAGWHGLFPGRTWRWALASGFAALLVVWGAAHHVREQRARAEARRASAEARVALRIASTKLNAVLRDAARPQIRGFESSE